MPTIAKSGQNVKGDEKASSQPVLGHDTADGTAPRQPDRGEKRDRGDAVRHVERHAGRTGEQRGLPGERLDVAEHVVAVQDEAVHQAGRKAQT